MGASAVMGGIGAGVNAITGIGSSVNSKREGKKASTRLDQQQNAMMDTLLGVAGDNGARSGGMLGDLTDGAFGAVGGLQDRVLSGGQQLNDLASQLQGINPQYDFARHQFSDAPSGLGGYDFDAGGRGAPDLQGMGFGGVDFGSSYNFRPGQDLMNQTMDTFRTEEAGVRANALDQMAMQSGSNMGGLDAALAARGVGRGSGVASGALADLAGQQGQQMAGLERDLATLGSQTALQGAQFDVNRQLQEDQMQSSYNLGERQMISGGQLQQMGIQAQHNLGMNQLRSSNWLGDQQMRSNYSLAQDQLASQNWLADQQMRSQYDLGFQDMSSRYGLSQAELQQRGLGMAGDLISTGMGHDTQASLGIGNMYAGMLSPVLSSLLGMQEIGGRNVAAAGQGAGAGMSGLGSGLMDMAKSGVFNKD